jgi:hypothetical protein
VEWVNELDDKLSGGLSPKPETPVRPDTRDSYRQAAAAVWDQTHDDLRNSYAGRCPDKTKGYLLKVARRLRSLSNPNNLDNCVL